MYRTGRNERIIIRNTEEAELRECSKGEKVDLDKTNRNYHEILNDCHVQYCLLNLNICYIIE